jgi:salicylate hydroxylase
MTPGTRILIIGGGIGGLTAALALLRAGFDARVYEQAPSLGEVGAGLTLSKGALRCCDSLGIGEAVRRETAALARFPFLHFRSGVPLGTPIVTSDTAEAERDGHIYRPDFHRVLVGAVRAHGDDRIMLGHSLASIQQEAGSVTAHFLNGQAAVGGLLIGADGARSVVRRLLFGEAAAPFTRRIAFRFLLPAEMAGPHLTVGGPACVFIGHGRVFNRYLVSHGRLLNCVAIQRHGDWTHDGWNQPAAVEELLAGFAGWHPEVLALMRLAPPDRLIKWGIFARPAREQWTLGRVALLGDAAHPMQPFLGLGAAMAVEDGTILGRAVAEMEDWQSALAAYARVRIPRANKVLALSKMQGDLFDSVDPGEFPPKDAPSHDPLLGAYDPESVRF